MIDGQVMRTDAELFGMFFPNRAERLADELRKHFTPREARLFGIEQAYGEDEESGDGMRAAFAAAGAVLATVALYASVAYLATLGMSESAYPVTVFTATLA